MTPVPAAPVRRGPPAGRTRRTAGPAVAVALALIGGVGTVVGAGTGPGAGEPGPRGAAAVGTGATIGGRWVLPVPAPVVDPYREPSDPWGPGNRGWELGSTAGEVVVAPGGGTVAFAGPVAGRGVVTIDHGGGLVSSLTGLRGVAVAAGTAVAPGSPVGTAMPGLHLGFRLAGRYIDPARVYGRRLHARLVPLPG